MDELEKKIDQESELGLKLCQEGNLEEGIEHLKFAAERNDLTAIVNIGHAYKMLGNYEEALKWTLVGAEKGHKIAISNLCIMYRHGEGTDCDVDKCVQWAKKLIELGEIDNGYQEIVCAYLYATSEYQRNFEKAFEYALEGSKKIIVKNPKPKRGDACETIIQLALCYDFGKGTEVNKREALKYYLYCAKCGAGIALYNAACIYGYSEDESMCDIQRCTYLLKEATKLGYADAWYELGYLYHVGEKVEKDLNKAKFFYAKAIRCGNGECHYKDAVENLKEISEEDAKRILSGKYCPLID